MHKTSPCMLHSKSRLKSTILKRTSDVFATSIPRVCFLFRKLRAIPHYGTMWITFDVCSLFLTGMGLASTLYFLHYVAIYPSIYVCACAYESGVFRWSHFQISFKMVLIHISILSNHLFIILSPKCYPVSVGERRSIIVALLYQAAYGSVNLLLWKREWPRCMERLNSRIRLYPLDRWVHEVPCSSSWPCKMDWCEMRHDCLTLNNSIKYCLAYKLNSGVRVKSLLLLPSSSLQPHFISCLARDTIFHNPTFFPFLSRRLMFGCPSMTTLRKLPI